MAKELKQEVANEELEKARKLIEEQEREKLEACSKEIQDVLNKYGFDIKVTEPRIFLSKKQ